MKKLIIFLNLFLISTVYTQVKTVRDNFNTVSFSNNDGSDSWTSDWIENDVAGVGPSTGNVYITTNKLSFDDEPDTGTEPSAEREADISSAIGLSATLTFDLETGPGQDINSDYLTVSVSSDGGTNYIVLEAITEAGSYYGGRSYDISAYASTETRIKFSITGFTGVNDEFFKLDNVQIQYSDLEENVRDNFSTVSFSNNDGTIPWTTDWIEDDVAGVGPSTGNVYITTNQLSFDDEPDTGTEPGAEREADLTDGIDGTVTLTFDFETGPGLDSGSDYLTISVSSDGGTNYTALEAITGAGSVTGSKSYDITAYASSETRIKFSITGFTGVNDEFFKIDNVTITITHDYSTSNTVSRSIATGTDDAEEEDPTESSPYFMYLNSTDLEIVSDFDSPHGVQKIGLRFINMTIPVGATITNAYLTLTCISADAPMTNSDATNLNIHGHLISDAPTFTSTASNISDRLLTTTSTSWVPASWTTGLTYNSPSMVNVIQEIVDQGTWASGNSIAIIITGTGHRATPSYEGSPSEAAMLVVEYEESVLPVELTNFSISFYENTPKLKWSTETETNNIGFEIERKFQDEKQSWETIGFVKGYGHSNSPKYYSFTDENINTNSNYLYRLKQLDNDGSYEYSKIIELVQSVPSNFSLSQNYPNPFNPTTTIEYTIPNVDGDKNIRSVQLKVYDMLGSEIVTLVNKKQNPGSYKVNFDASKFTTGIYFYTIRAGDFVATKKMLFVK